MPKLFPSCIKLLFWIISGFSPFKTWFIYNFSPSKIPFQNFDNCELFRSFVVSCVQHDVCLGVNISKRAVVELPFLLLKNRVQIIHSFCLA